MRFSLRLWIRSLTAFLRRAPITSAGEWNEDDREALAQFLATTTGRHLRKQLTAQIASANERCVMNAGDPLSAGWAQGYRALLGTLTAFSELSPEQIETNPAPGGLTTPRAADIYAS